MHENHSTEEVDAWRAGKRDYWPAPDGRGYSIDVHPLAQTGAITLIEAWEIARPWFVDPDAKPFMMNAVHPNLVQGEYDLVYRWGNQEDRRYQSLAWKLRSLRRLCRTTADVCLLVVEYT